MITISTSFFRSFRRNRLAIALTRCRLAPAPATWPATMPVALCRCAGGNARIRRKAALSSISCRPSLVPRMMEAACRYLFWPVCWVKRSSASTKAASAPSAWHQEARRGFRLPTRCRLRAPSSVRALCRSGGFGFAMRSRSLAARTR